MHEVNGAFSLDGVVYITESTANGSLKNLNSVVGEEVGEIYAQNNGLENDYGRGQQIGLIFGNQLSGVSGESISTNKIAADDVDLSDVVVAGTNAFGGWAARTGARHGRRFLERPGSGCG